MKAFPSPAFLRTTGALFALAAAASGHAQSFTVLPGLTYAAFVSNDGKVVAGGLPGYDYVAARWTQATGATGLGTFAGAGVFARDYVTGMSADGSVILANVSSGVGASGNHTDAVHWTQSSGLVGIGHLPGHQTSFANAVSGDGSVIVGSSVTGFVPGSGRTELAYRWTQQGGMESLGYLGGFSWNPESVATDISSEGAVIVGTSGAQAFRWTEATGMQGLGFFAGGLKISGDGNVIVGWQNAEPFRYTSDLGLVPLGHPELTANGGGLISALTQDGGIILGMTSDLFNNPYPFIWSQSSGLRDFRNVLTDVFGLGDELAGWKNVVGYDISADGRFIVGGGNDPSGIARGWLIDLGLNPPALPPGTDTPPPNIRPVPEPATYGLSAALGLGAWVIVRRKRRTR